MALAATPAAAGVAIFIWWQTRTPCPLIDPKLVSNRNSPYRAQHERVASGVISICLCLGKVAGISVLAALLSAPASGRSFAEYRQAILPIAGAFLVAALVSLLPPWRARHQHFKFRRITLKCSECQVYAT